MLLLRIFKKWKKSRDCSRRRSAYLRLGMEQLEPRQLMTVNSMGVAKATSPPDTIDLAIKAITYDPTGNLRNPNSNSPRLFQVDVKLESLTGRMENNVEVFRVNLYWARGPRLLDRIGLAATGTMQFSHTRYQPGATIPVVLPNPSTATTVYRQPATASYLVAEITDVVGAIESDKSDNVGALRVPTASEIATRVLGNSNINLATTHVSGNRDSANARDNIRDVAAGRLAQRSSYSGAPGGQTELDTRMLNGLLMLARQYRFSVSEIAGGVHSSSTSRHYKGLAFDVTEINGQRVSTTHPTFRAFMQRARELGANEVLGPGDSGHANHVHLAWPNNPQV